MHAKLDEIIRALGEARSQFIGIEHHTDSEIQHIRSEPEDPKKSAARRAMTESCRPTKARNGS